jgi:hypothetical protein
VPRKIAQLRLSGEERAAAYAAAQQSGMTFSSWVRRLINLEVEGTKPVGSSRLTLVPPSKPKSVEKVEVANERVPQEDAVPLEHLIVDKLKRYEGGTAPLADRALDDAGYRRLVCERHKRLNCTQPACVELGRE